MKATAQDQEQLLLQLRAISDPTRLRILELLKRPGCCSCEEIDRRSPGMCVCDLEKEFRLTQPTITHHLQVLRDAGLVECRKLGLWVYCKRNEEAIRRLGESLTEV